MVDIRKGQLANQFTTATHCNTPQQAPILDLFPGRLLQKSARSSVSYMQCQFTTCNVNLRHAMSIYDMQCQFTTCNVSLRLAMAGQTRRMMTW